MWKDKQTVVSGPEPLDVELQAWLILWFLLCMFSDVAVWQGGSDLSSVDVDGRSEERLRVLTLRSSPDVLDRTDRLHRQLTQIWQLELGEKYQEQDRDKFLVNIEQLEPDFVFIIKIQVRRIVQHQFKRQTGSLLSNIDNLLE